MDVLRQGNSAGSWLLSSRVSTSCLPVPHHTPWYTVCGRSLFWETHEPLLSHTRIHSLRVWYHIPCIWRRKAQKLDDPDRVEDDDKVLFSRSQQAFVSARRACSEDIIYQMNFYCYLARRKRTNLARDRPQFRSLFTALAVVVHLFSIFVCGVSKRWFWNRHAKRILDSIHFLNSFPLFIHLFIYVFIHSSISTLVVTSFNSDKQEAANRGVANSEL